MLHCKADYFYHIFNNLCILGFCSAWGSGSCGGGVGLLAEVDDVSNALCEAEHQMVHLD